MADTYGPEAYSRAVRDFTEEWLKQNAALKGANEGGVH